MAVKESVKVAEEAFAEFERVAILRIYKQLSRSLGIVANSSKTRFLRFINGFVSRLNRSPDLHGNINVMRPVASSACPVCTPSVLHNQAKLGVQLPHGELWRHPENLTSNDRCLSHRICSKRYVILFPIKLSNNRHERL